MFVTSFEWALGAMRGLRSRSSGRRLACSAAALLFLAGTASLSVAASINYGSFIGNTVTYVNVTEDTNTGDPLPLFGSPTVIGDSIDFDPIGFSAQSSGGGVDITDGQLKFMVVAKSDPSTDFAIDSISFAEAGDTTLAGMGTDATFTAVAAYVFIDIQEVDGVGINPIKLLKSLVFNPSGGTYGLGTDGGGGPYYTTSWTGSLLVDLTQALIDKGVKYDLGVTKMSVNIDNVLVAISQPHTYSVIAKKDFGGLSVTVNQPGQGEIPEPTSIALALVGLALVAVRRARYGS